MKNPARHCGHTTQKMDYWNATIVQMCDLKKRPRRCNEKKCPMVRSGALTKMLRKKAEERRRARINRLYGHMD